jgi:hypothetical protein
MMSFGSCPPPHELEQVSFQRQETAIFSAAFWRGVKKSDRDLSYR